MKKFLSIYLFVLVSYNFSAAQDVSLSNEPHKSCQEGYDLYNDYKFDKAIEKLILCYENNKENLLCLNKIASCYYKLGRLGEAKNNYYRILERDSSNLNAINQLALIYAMESQYSKSIEQYQKLVLLDSTNSYYFKQIGFLSLKLDHVEDGVHYLEKAFALNQEDIQLFIELSNIYEKLNLYGKATEYVEEGLLKDSSNVKLLLTKSKIAYSQKNYEQVVQSIDRILKVQKDTTLYMLKLLGISQFHLNHYSIAINLLERVIDKGQGSEIIHYYLALAYQSTANYQKSILHFELAIEDGVTDNLSSYYTNLAKAYELSKNYQESIKAYKVAYKSSKNTLLLYHLARNYDAFYEDKKTALHYYERYLAANDSGNVAFKNYSRHRVSELNEILHFGLDTLN